MMLSFELIKEVSRELRKFPQHAYKVIQHRLIGAKVHYKKYYFGKHPKQYLCWFEPAKHTQDAIILFFHGGAWTFGSPELFNNRATLFTKLGYTVVMPSHRKLPQFGFSDIREDLSLILNKIGQLLVDKGISNKKIILGGMSSGGNLAALLLFDNSILLETTFKKEDFTGAFLCAAPLNLKEMTPSFVLTKYAGKRASNSFRKASPINHIPSHFSKPILIIHGTKDGLVKFDSVRIFVEKLNLNSLVPVDFHIIPDGSHLDAVSWAYEDNAIRKVVFNWLEKVKGSPSGLPIL